MYKTNDYGEEVYLKIAEVLNFKFKTHLSGSGITFKKIFASENLLSGEKAYIIFLNDMTLYFTGLNDFLYGFFDYIKFKLNEVENETKSLEYHANNDRFFDDRAYYDGRANLEERDYRLSKLYNQIEKKLESINKIKK